MLFGMKYGQLEDLTGKSFGRLTVISMIARRPEVRPDPVRWLCQCSCGAQTITVGTSLRGGDTKSCGCYRREWAKTHCHEIKHGMHKTAEYNIWHGMKTRCLNPNAPDFPMYGGRGITVCEHWKNSFTSFFSDMGARPPKSSLERIDTNGPYAPDNCRWATPTEQQRNRRDSIFLIYKGERLNIHVWAERLGVQAGFLVQRLRNGWSSERIIEEPRRLNQYR